MKLQAMIPALIIPICFLPVFLIIFAARGNQWNSYYRAYKKQQEYFAMHQISLDQLRNIPPGPVKTAFPGNSYVPPNFSSTTATTFASVGGSIPKTDLIYCNQCGARNRKDAHFCEKCGTSLH